MLLFDKIYELQKYVSKVSERDKEDAHIPGDSILDVDIEILDQLLNYAKITSKTD
jgi:hypothetical protein